MKVIGFIGASGTGKSHHALDVAYDHHISCIIDDGLLIYQNRIVAGRSAKEETNRMKAVRRAIFLQQEHAQSVKDALDELQPDQLLILGTSKHMIHRICEALGLPEADSYIRIEDVSCPVEIEKARTIRINEGKHIIPVPTMELKPRFRGYLLAPIHSLLTRRNQKAPDFEHSVVRPVFSYYGKLTFSNEMLEHLIIHRLRQIGGLAKVNRLRIDKNRESEGNGLAVFLVVTVYYGENLKKLMSTIKKGLQQDIEYTTGMSFEILKITVRGIVPR